MGKGNEGGGGRKGQEGRERREEGGSGHALYASFWLCRRVLCRVRGRDHFQPQLRSQRKVSAKQCVTGESCENFKKNVSCFGFANVPFFSLTFFKNAIPHSFLHEEH